MEDLINEGHLIQIEVRLAKVLDKAVCWVCMLSETLCLNHTTVQQLAWMDSNTIYIARSLGTTTVAPGCPIFFFQKLFPDIS